MKRILLFAFAMVVIAASTSCIRKELEVADKSIVRSVELVMDNDNDEWEINEERRVTVIYNPKDAVITDLEILQSEDIFEIRQTKERNVFDLVAIKEGKGVFKAVANDVKSKELKFRVVDNTPPKVCPEVNVGICKTSETDKIEVCPSNVRCDYNGEYLISVQSGMGDLSFSLESSDNGIVEIVWYGERSWVLSARAPGLASLQMTAIEADGTEWARDYNFMVYGHITLETECDPVDGVAGFAVYDMEFEPLEANVYVTAILSGWPGYKKELTETYRIPAFNQVLSLGKDSEYPEILNIKEGMRWFDDKGVIDNTYYWGGKLLEMYYLISLDNPYIIIDDIIDENDRDAQWSNFKTVAYLEQVGVAECPVDDKDEGNWIIAGGGPESGPVSDEGTGSGSSGWVEHDIDIEL